MKDLIQFKREWVFWLILLFPFIMAVMYFDELPKQIPTHFGINGQADQWMPKAQGLFLLPVINVVLYLFLLFVPYIDPKQKNYLLFESAYFGIRLSVHLLLSGLFVFIVFYSLEKISNANEAIGYLLFSFFILLGNFMSKVRYNYLVGIRLPWTLNNENVWNQTHRLTGKLWTLMGLLCILLNVFLHGNEWILLSFIAFIVISPFVLALYFHKKNQNEA